MFRGKNRLSPPEDAVDERLSHGKTVDVLTVLWKNRRCPQFCKCDISGSSLEPFNCHLSQALASDNWTLFHRGHKLEFNISLLPNNYVLNSVGLAIRMNEDDCLNPMTSNEFGVVR